MPHTKHVVIVGAGSPGLGCARRLAGRDDIRVTLIDKHNYHQFQPLFLPGGQVSAAERLDRHARRLVVTRGPEAVRVGVGLGPWHGGLIVVLAGGPLWASPAQALFTTAP